jgi:hypothetical protein
MINNVQIRSLLCLNKDFDKLKSLVDKFDYNIAIVSVPDIGVLRGLSGADEASLAQTIVFNQSNFKAQLSEIFNACDINIYENEKIYEKNTPLTIDNSRKILPVFSRRNYLGYVAKDEALPRKKRTWYAEYPDLRRQYWPENLNSLIN